MKVSIPLCKPEDADFPEYRDKDQLDRWLWRIVQIPYPLYLITTVDENDVPNVEVNTWTMPFGFAPYQMFLFVCGMAHHTAQNAILTGEFVVNVPGDELGDRILRAAKPYPRGVDEVTEAGFTALSAEVLRPPRIAECKAHFECRVMWHKETDDQGGVLIAGQVVAASADQDVVVGDVQAKIDAMGTIYVMPWNVDLERMALTGDGTTTAFAGIGEVRFTIDRRKE
jgi:flavin reductase (DIM6/NTAB) family NADH-FMN oxidoreductase RutF